VIIANFLNPGNICRARQCIGHWFAWTHSWDRAGFRWRGSAAMASIRWFGSMKRLN